MAKVYDNAALVAKDNDGNSATLRGGSKEDWEKIGKGLEQIGNLNEAVLKLKDRVVGAIGSMPEVVDATDAQKGITLLTDDPNADKNAATGVTAATPKAIQTAVAELKEELAQATVELNDANATQKGITLLTDDPKANKDAATGVTAATPKAIQAAVAELQEQIADATVELVDGSDTQKGVVYLTDDPNADKDAATGVTAATPKAIQDALAELQEKIESGEIAPPEPNDSIDTPTVTVTGAPSSVPARPTITVSAYSGTDTYLCTNWKVIKTGGSEEVVFETTTATSTLQLTRGLLKESTSYTFMAQYKGVKGTLSEWGSCNATTLATFSQEAGDIGLPNDPAFGVGVAPEEVYKSLNLKPLPGTENPESFQYGLYEATAPDDEDDTHIQTYHAYVKYIPKFYYCFLREYYNGRMSRLREEKLADLVQYTGLSVAQLKQAQARGGISAIALAPATSFEDEADANEHGFFLCRGFIDGNREMPGFFIANTLTSYFESSDAAGNTEIQYYCGAPSHKFEPTYKYSDSQRKGLAFMHTLTPEKRFGLDGTTADCAIQLAKKFSGFNNISAGMWQAIRMICFASGLYCKGNTECAWFRGDADTGYYLAAPYWVAVASLTPVSSGQNGVTITPPLKAPIDYTTSTPDVEGTGTVWIDQDELYPHTTHSGRIHGIGNFSGWAYTYLIGLRADWKTAPLTMKLVDVSSYLSEFGENPTALPHPIYETNTKYNLPWGGNATNMWPDKDISPFAWPSVSFDVPEAQLGHTPAWESHFLVPSAQWENDVPTEHHFNGEGVEPWSFRRGGSFQQADSNPMGASGFRSVITYQKTSVTGQQASRIGAYPKI